jgi:DNA (cytosine-5)-methyltransferase 1
MSLTIGSLFTGYGGLDQAVSQVTGGETVWVSDIDKGACKILAHRYPDVPNLGDITTIDWTSVEPVDILTGGFPCQDLSHAGKGAGLKTGTRSGLWSHMADAVETLKPRLVVVENVRGLLSASAPGDVEPCPWCVGDGTTFDLRALGTVLADLANIGYDTQWCGLRAADVGAAHGRFRVFLTAYPNSGGGHETIKHNGSAPTNGSTVLNQSDCVTDGVGPIGDVTLLPTPAANDMGGNKTLEWWDEWTEKLREKHNNTNGHGPSLGIEVRRGFGKYADAVNRWTNVIGRESPPPTQPTGREGAEMLSSRFVEWMMGLPDGWVSDVPGLTRNEALKALGNGVVPQQAATALRFLLEGMEDADTTRSDTAAPV